MTRSLHDTAKPVRTVLLIGLLVATLALSGCHDLSATKEHGRTGPAGDPAGDAAGDDPDIDGNGTGNGTVPSGPPQRNLTEPPAPELDVSLGAVSGPIYTRDEVSLSVSVSGDRANASWLGVRWSRDSSGDTQALSPGDFDGAVAVGGENRSVPGGFQASWSPPGAGLFHLRAHVEVAGAHHWSDELVVQVTPAVEEVDAEADHTVRMRTNVFDPCAGDSYNVSTLEIQAGESVDWVNAASCDHTAMHNDTEPLWSTGTIEPNERSGYAYRFNKPGTYAVRCAIHDGMTMQVVVS